MGVAGTAKTLEKYAHYAVNVDHDVFLDSRKEFTEDKQGLKGRVNPTGLISDSSTCGTAGRPILRRQPGYR